MGVSELRELRQLKEETAQLKQMVADLSLDKQMLQDIVKKSSEAAPEAAPERIWSVITKCRCGGPAGCCSSAIRCITTGITGAMTRPCVQGCVRSLSPVFVTVAGAFTFC